MMPSTRYFSGRKFRCVQPGLWLSADRTVLREEMKGAPNHHDWVAEKWGAKDWDIVEQYGIGLSLGEAAATIPEVE